MNATQREQKTYVTIVKWGVTMCPKSNTWQHHIKIHIPSQRSLLDLKEADDKLEAKADIDQIDTIVNNYFNGYGYDPITAYQLDKRIRQEYPIIESINYLSPTTVSRVPKANPTPAIAPVISNLKQDRFGILFTILLKEGYVHKLEDFVDWVE